MHPLTQANDTHMEVKNQSQENLPATLPNLPSPLSNLPDSLPNTLSAPQPALGATPSPRPKDKNRRVSLGMECS